MKNQRNRPVYFYRFEEEWTVVEVRDRLRSVT